MPTIQVDHTADLDPEVLRAARALLFEVFADLSEADWDHALGGVHALAWDGPVLVGHASVVQRRLVHGGRALRVGYVEGVAVRPSHRRRGLAGALMGEVERVVRAAYDLGALGASDEARALYAGRGWQPWRGPSSALTPVGLVRTPDDDAGIHVLVGNVPLDLDAELVCDWRDGDVW